LAPLQGRSFWEPLPPMGPPENHTSSPAKQAAGRRRQAVRRPRARRCLLKGCEERFHPRQAGQRYCSPQCREAARAWSRWKAQKRYRETAVGKQKRNGQSLRYRERARSGKPPEPEAVGEAARVITQAHFFRPRLRSAGLLRMLRASAAKSLAAFLFGSVPSSAGSRSATGAPLEADAHLIRTY
jgi:hypothetical protein